uniref:C2H2-type domain-containing protein n=1 Tax=Meloidogyne hapla TaxID=6305 RepID=A0A1I8BKN3_MELHA
MNVTSRSDAKIIYAIIKCSRGFCQQRTLLIHKQRDHGANVVLPPRKNASKLKILKEKEQ